MKFGASADQYIDSSTQISANDCHSLSVESARSACLSAHGSSDAAIGATSGSAGGTAQAPTASGLRTALLPEVAKRKDAAVREARR